MVQAGAVKLSQSQSVAELARTKTPEFTGPISEEEIRHAIRTLFQSGSEKESHYVTAGKTEIANGSKLQLDFVPDGTTRVARTLRFLAARETVFLRWFTITYRKSGTYPQRDLSHFRQHEVGETRIWNGKLASTPTHKMLIRRYSRNTPLGSVALVQWAGPPLERLIPYLTVAQHLLLHMEIEQQVATPNAEDPIPDARLEVLIKMLEGKK